MKTCPNCGSALADNEPYCENCGFDPYFDYRDWDGNSSYSGKIYVPKEHIKSSRNADDENLLRNLGILLLCVLLVISIVYLDGTYDWDIRLFIGSNLDSIFMLIILWIIFVMGYKFYNNL